MTIEELDSQCNDLFRRLEQLRLAGQGDSEAYTQTLAILRDKTRERIGIMKLGAL